MTKILILVGLLLGLIKVNAQKEYFFYFQSEGRLSFFLKMNDKVYSAHPEGYLILPRLIDSTYAFSIGTNGTDAMEARFSVPVNGKDRGFLIRAAENRFQLFDMQSLRVIQASESGSRSGTSFIRKEDPFTRLLALAADDSSLLYVYQQAEKPRQSDLAAVKKTETETIKDPIRSFSDDEVVGTPRTRDTVRMLPQETTTRIADTTVSRVVADGAPADTLLLKPPVINPDATAQVESSAAADTVATAPGVAEEEPPKKGYYKKSVVLRRSESSTTEGFGLVFLDNHEAGVDTIRLLIPNPRMVYQKEQEPDLQETKKFLDLTSEPVVQDTVVVDKPALPKGNSCSAVAGNADFLKLRKYMAAREKEEDMVAEARKYFRTKCFATAQIKHLSALFLTDRGKYLFFDAAYKRVTDKDQFTGLQAELQDSYFIDRFKVLTGN